MNVNPATVQMYTFNHLAGGTMERLFSLHPPIQERINLLRAMS